ncbi:hypothetical protein LINPERPRIM_LOCUS39605 [Linum perenne]
MVVMKACTLHFFFFFAKSPLGKPCGAYLPSGSKFLLGFFQNDPCL